MFQLDETFLADVGLNDLPNEQKKPFLQHIYDELELRVGTKLSDGMSDAQLEEFEAIIDRKTEIVDNWLRKNIPNFKDDQMFIQIQTSSGLGSDDDGLKAEYVATKWLEVNRPDYRQIVAQTLVDLKKEVASSRDLILGKN